MGSKQRGSRTATLGSSVVAGLTDRRHLAARALPARDLQPVVPAVPLVSEPELASVDAEDSELLVGLPVVLLVVSSLDVALLPVSASSVDPVPDAVEVSLPSPLVPFEPLVGAVVPDGIDPHPERCSSKSVPSLWQQPST